MQVMNATVVEKLVANQQAEISDVRVGDHLVAVDQYDLIGASAKATLRLFSTLQWPRILVFESRNFLEDPEETQKKVASRSMNITIIYPPSLVGTFHILLADWAPLLELPKKNHGVCPLYRIKAPFEDPFGCKPHEDEYAMPGAYEEIKNRDGEVDEQVLLTHPYHISIMLTDFSLLFLISSV